jgi:hypothetical protein
MNLDISRKIREQLLQNAHAHGLSIDGYLQLIMEEQQREFIAAVEEGVRDMQEGKVRPAREALTDLGKKRGFSR